MYSDFDGDISEWDTSNIKSMENTFAWSNYTGEYGDISNWDVSNVKDMSYMFYTSNFTGKNSPGMDKWDVSNVEKMDSMFEQSKFEQDISGWEIDPICSTEAMFAHCPLSNKHKFIPQCLIRRI